MWAHDLVMIMRCILRVSASRGRTRSTTARTTNSGGPIRARARIAEKTFPPDGYVPEMRVRETAGGGANGEVTRRRGSRNSGCPPLLCDADAALGDRLEVMCIELRPEVAARVKKVTSEASEEMS